LITNALDVVTEEYRAILTVESKTKVETLTVDDLEGFMTEEHRQLTRNQVHLIVQ
jgi:hypothetical protein